MHMKMAVTVKMPRLEPLPPLRKSSLSALFLAAAISSAEKATKQSQSNPATGRHFPMVKLKTGQKYSMSLDFLLRKSHISYIERGP